MKNKMKEGSEKGREVRKKGWRERRWLEGKEGRKEGRREEGRKKKKSSENKRTASKVVVWTGTFCFTP
jgi:hypothetical protein